MKKIISLLLSLAILVSLFVFVIIPATARGSYKTGDLIAFGSYPQSKVTDDELINTLNAQRLEWRYFNYFNGDEHDNYKQYADFSLDGAKYRAVYSVVNGRDSLSWFRFEPIVWRVLDPDAGLILSEYVIDTQPFEKDNFDGYGDENHEHYASNWAYSSLREWMNGELYDTAFSAEEQKLIQKTRLTTTARWDSQFDADPTEDFLFPLSFIDVSKAEYGFENDSDRKTYRTEYANIKQDWHFKYDDWILRSPGNSNNIVGIYNSGDYSFYYSTDNADGGVRAALTVDLHSSKFADQYNVRFDANGGTMEPPAQVFRSGVKVIIPSKEPVREDYKFIGWAKSSGATKASFEPSKSYSFDDSITLYAVWQEKEICTLTYDANGGSLAAPAKTFRAGDSVTISSVEPTREGYYFYAWSKDKTPESEKYFAGRSYDFFEDTTLYAIWKRECKITYDANGGLEAPPPQSFLTYDYVYLTYVRPYRDVYRFLGWSTNKDGKTPEYDYSSHVFYDDITLYAVWENADAYKTGDVNGDALVLADDARLALRTSARLEILSYKQLIAADVDRDGKVLANDARQILRFSAKLQNAFEIVANPTPMTTTLPAPTAATTIPAPTTEGPQYVSVFF